MKKYINNLSNCTMSKYQVANWEGRFLSVNGITKLRDVAAFKQLLAYYDECITDKTSLLQVWDKIKTVQYLNVGCYAGENYENDVNHHIFIINDQKFEYTTGTGINCQENKSYCYNIYKLLFDCIYSLLDEYNLVMGCTMDDFLEEFGYCTDLETIRKGENIYRQIQSNNQKLLTIFSAADAENVREYIEL